MMFQHDHDLAVDAIAGPDRSGSALIGRRASPGKRRDDGYSYVFVHRERAAVAQPLAQRRR